MNTVQRYRKADWSKVWHFRQFHGNFANITYFENMESLNSRWFCLGKRFQTFFGGMDVVVSPLPTKSQLGGARGHNRVWHGVRAAVDGVANELPGSDKSNGCQKMMTVAPRRFRFQPAHTPQSPLYWKPNASWLHAPTLLEKYWLQCFSEFWQTVLRFLANHVRRYAGRCRQSTAY